MLGARSVFRRSLHCSPLLGLWLWAGCGEDTRADQIQGELRHESQLDFGDVQVGIERPIQLLVENVGEASIDILEVETSEGFRTDDWRFSLSEQQFRVPPGGSVELTVSFLSTAIMERPVESSFRLITNEAEGAPDHVISVRGRGIRSGLRVEPEPVDFGTVLIGASKSMLVRITNDLSTPTPVRTRVDGRGLAEIVNQSGLGQFDLVRELGPNGSLIQDGGLLEPGASISVELRFVPDPTREGIEDRGRWTLANCDTLACERQVLLTGRGTNSALSCEPEVLVFGDVNPNTTLGRRLTCRNATSENVTITGWSLDSTSAGEFQAETYAGNVSALGPGESFDVNVSFSPTQASVGAVSSGSLVIRGRNPRANVDLTPTRIPLEATAGGPDIRVQPETVDFARVGLGSTSRLRVLVENVGHKELTVSSVSLEQGQLNVFSLTQNAFVVPAGDAKVIELSYSPLTEGTHQAELLVVSDDPDQPEWRVAVIGRGEDLPPCSYLVTPESLSFGIVEVLRTTSQGVRIQNLGQNDCVINNLSVALGSSPAFGLAAETPSELVLSPGESVRVVVEYVPLAEGEDLGTLSFYISDPLRSQQQIPLRGLGATGALLVSPGELDFGRIGVGCGTRDRYVTIYNTGTSPTTVNAVEVPPGVSSEFSLRNLPVGLPAPPGVSIAPGQSIDFSVSYRSADSGPDTGVLHVLEAGKLDPYVVPLYGEGATDPINEDRYTQLESPEVDILFVIDNSCSMSDEQASLGGNFSSFIAFADSQQLDYRISVISTDVEAGFPGPRCPDPLSATRPSGLAQGACGYFADGNGDGSVRDPAWRLIEPNEQPTPGSAFATVATQGTAGSGNEQGLEAAYQALSAPLITGWNAGFLRPDAYLALVFVSDEDDHSLRTVPFYENYFRAIKGFRNSQLFSASAIVGDPNTGCGLQAEAGSRYIQLANDTGGVFESICTQDWSRALENLGRTVFGYKSRFSLSNQPVPSTVEVEVDGVPIIQTTPSGQTRWTYDETTNSVGFAPLAIPEPGSEVVIRYQAECL